MQQLLENEGLIVENDKILNFNENSGIHPQKWDEFLLS
jgi:hypothetical protein